MSDHITHPPMPIHESMDPQSPSPSLTGICPPTLLGNPTSRRHCKHRRFTFFASPRMFLLALCFTAALCGQRSHAFSSSIQKRAKTSASSSRRSSSFIMSSVAERPAETNQPMESNTPPRLSDFQQRMKGLIKRNGVAQKKEAEKPSNIKTVHTLLDYKKELEQGSDTIVVVRFFATWCKACKAIQPSFYRMASLYPHITFLEVPVTNDNSNLHQGLAVPSLPYGHIYYPSAGLVEELKISKKYFPSLVKMVRWYDAGNCGLDEFEPPLAGNEDL